MEVKYQKKAINEAINASKKGWGCFARCCNLRTDSGTDMRYA